MPLSTVGFLLLSCVLVIGTSRADVSLRSYDRFGRLTTRLQRIEVAASPTPYPAAGYRPDRQFTLPQKRTPFITVQQQQPNRDNDIASPNILPSKDISRPDVLYGAPARLRQQIPARLRQPISARQQFLPQAEENEIQRIYGAPDLTPANAEPQAARLSAPKSARISQSNREDQEDDDETVTDIEVDTKTMGKKAVTTNPMGTVAYFPAGAVSFVHPLAAYVAGSTAYTNSIAAPLLQQQYVATPFLQQQIAYAQPAQLQAW